MGVAAEAYGDALAAPLPESALAFTVREAEGGGIALAQRDTPIFGRDKMTGF